MRDIRYLDVWHKAHAFTLHAFKTTDHFPRTETLGLANTLRRGASLTTMKIAEGCGHDQNAEYRRCLQHSRAITVDVEYQLLLARDLTFIPPDVHDALQRQVVEVRRMLSGLLKATHNNAA